MKGEKISISRVTSALVWIGVGCLGFYFVSSIWPFTPPPRRITTLQQIRWTKAILIVAREEGKDPSLFRIPQDNSWLLNQKVARVIQEYASEYEVSSEMLLRDSNGVMFVPDGWKRPLNMKSELVDGVMQFEIWSNGPDGKDDGGEDDDVVYRKWDPKIKN